MTTTVTRKSSLAPSRAAGVVPPERRAGFRLYERRWRDASFILVERRKGKGWMYGCIVLAASLWTYLLCFVKFG